ncbi:MAG: metal-sensitive transcriptional regulator [Anaerolineae bacterium]|nr:metal-sensitive transcriptional regulator [Anaerolineae bacterium]
MMKVQSQAVKDDLHRRLRRIEGQVRGVQRMLEDDRDCREIVQQLNAVHAAVGTATHQFMRAYAKDCLLQAGDEGQDAAAVIDDLLDLIAKVKA